MHKHAHTHMYGCMHAFNAEQSSGAAAPQQVAAQQDAVHHSTIHSHATVTQHAAAHCSMTHTTHSRGSGAVWAWLETDTKYSSVFLVCSL